MVVHTCNPSYLGDWGNENCSNPEAEVVVSQDHTTALQPGQYSETPSEKKGKKKNKMLEGNPNLARSTVIYQGTENMFTYIVTYTRIRMQVLFKLFFITFL